MRAKLVKESLNEISDELRKSATSKMRERGQDRRANNWDRHYDTKDLEKFKGMSFKDEEISFFEINEIGPKKVKVLRISLRSPFNKEYNKTYYSINYIIDEDRYEGVHNINRKDARLLSKIATTVNSDSQYKTGTGDLKITDY